MKSQITFLVLCILGMASCTFDAEYEAYHTFANSQWYADSAAIFTFKVEQPAKAYQIDCYLRNSLDYPYYNLYLQYELLDSDGKIVRSSLKESNLMNPQTGEPLGSGSGGIYDTKFPLISSHTFEQEGQYELRLKQYMRLDTLQGIYAVGFKLQELETQANSK